MARDEMVYELITSNLHFLRRGKLDDVLRVGVHELLDHRVGDLLAEIHPLDEFLFVYQQHFISVINNTALADEQTKARSKVG
jgi:hypothetical protein